MIGTVCAGLEAYSFFTGDSTRNDGESVDTRGARAGAVLPHTCRERTRTPRARRARSRSSPCTMGAARFHSLAHVYCYQSNTHTDELLLIAPPPPGAPSPRTRHRDLVLSIQPLLTPLHRPALA